MAAVLPSLILILIIAAIFYVARWEAYRDKEKDD